LREKNKPVDAPMLSMTHPKVFSRVGLQLGRPLSTLERTGWDVGKASIILKVSEQFLKGEIRKMGVEHRKENDKK